jgi:hypothetical protein
MTKPGLKVSLFGSSKVFPLLSFGLVVSDSRRKRVFKRSFLGFGLNDLKRNGLSAFKKAFKVVFMKEVITHGDGHLEVYLA